MENAGFLPNFEHNLAARAAMEQTVEDVVVLAAAAMTARVTFNMGGQVVNYVFDKVKKLWTKEPPPSFDDMVETYNLSNTVSLMESPAGSPVAVAQQIAKLEGQIKELTEKNATQQQMIALYNKERQALASTPQPQPPIAEKEADGKREPPAEVGVKIALPDPPTTTAKKTESEDEMYIKKGPWAVSKAIEVYVDYVKESMLKGVQVTMQDTNVINGQLVHNWGELVRRELGGKELQSTNTQVVKAKTLQDVRNVNTNGIYSTPTGKIRLNFGIPESDSSIGTSMYGGDVNRVANNNSDRGGGNGSPGDLDGNDVTTTHNRYSGKDDSEDRRRREFLLVKSSCVNVTTFTGYNLSRSPYIPFNTALRKFIMTQGQDGEELLTILDHVESYGDEKFSNIHAKALADVYPKAYEYARAVQAALLNWTEGAAHGLVEHGCDNVLDAWRRLYNRYIPGAKDLQNLFMEELMTLKPVSESEVDSIFIEVERIMEWYTKTSSQGDTMNNKWVRAALLKNLPKSITQHLAVQLRQAQTIDAVYNLVRVYLHDHSTGLPRGQTTAKLYLTEDGERDKEAPKEDKPESAQRQEEKQYNGEDNGDLNAATKGDKKGKGNGYGACWHCGVWGHPRRECPELVGQPKGSVNALKGKGKGFKGKGKGYKGGKGKSYKGGCNNYKGGYRSPGKAIGKGLNYYANDEYSEAWGNDHSYDYDYNYDDYNWGQENGYVGNLTMMLEKGCEKNKVESGKIGKQATAENIGGKERSKRRDALLGTAPAAPIKLRNMFGIFETDDADDDDDDGDEDLSKNVSAASVMSKSRRSANPNKMQRAKRRMEMAASDGDSESSVAGDELCIRETCKASWERLLVA